jgi:hypothetical protein
MDKIVEAFFAVFSEFTWRRFLALIILFGLLVLGFSLYERYTSTFRLSRLQRSAELLIKVHEMESAITNGSPELQHASHMLVDRSIHAVEIEPLSLDVLPTRLRFSTDYLWKFLAGCAMWVALAISRVSKIVRGDKASRTSAFGLLLFSILAGLVGIAIPPIWWPWFHLVVYPLSILGLFYIFVFTPFMIWWCSPLDKEKAGQKTLDKD